jgi:hypothetical protein
MQMTTATPPKKGTANSAAPAVAGPATDLKKRLAPLFNPPREPVLVDVPELGYLMIDGHGAPDEGAAYPTTDFQKCFAALYPMAYTIHFRLKKQGLAMPILPLEALWFTDEDGGFDVDVQPEDWGWRAMLAVSDDVTPEVYAEALEEVRRKKGNSEHLERLRLERWCEGRCAQIMHVGPYAAERGTIERLHAFIADQGLTRRGAHHEIYMGDPRRADPAKLKTVLRQPVSEG